MDSYEIVEEMKERLAILEKHEAHVRIAWGSEDELKYWIDKLSKELGK